MAFLEAFKADFFRMTGMPMRVDARCLVQFCFRHNVRFMYWFRKYAETGSIFSRYQLYRYSRKYGLEFALNAKIGSGIYIGHPYNITVGDGVSMGCNVNIHKGATIGVENRGKRMGAPTIGSNVYIGINATVVGKVFIGDDVMIAPGAFVNFDVPSHSVVVGNPGVIYPCEHATEDYVRNLV